MIIFWPVADRRHSCHPIAIDVTAVETIRNHSPDKAGYDVRVVEWSLAECPVCSRRYKYSDPKILEVKFEPYSEYA